MSVGPPLAVAAVLVLAWAATEPASSEPAGSVSSDSIQDASNSSDQGLVSEPDTTDTPVPDSGYRGSSTYQGIPRTEYEYEGGPTSKFQQWQSGDITTAQFDEFTGDSGGTAALVPPGEQFEGSPTRNGIPRSEYTYTGDERSDFERWVSGEIDTQTFAWATDPGEGTASLVPPSEA